MLDDWSVSYVLQGLDLNMAVAKARGNSILDDNQTA